MIGLPLKVLIESAEAVKTELKRPLDVVLNYAHMTLQNATLKTAVPRFHAAGVKRVFTASPLSMGLLRAEGPQPWHPATESQKQAVRNAIILAQKQGYNLADVSMQFVFANWDSCVIGGWSSIKELESAVEMWHIVKTRQFKDEVESLWKASREAMGEDVDTMWASPGKGWVFSDGSKIE